MADATDDFLTGKTSAAPAASAKPAGDPVDAFLTGKTKETEAPPAIDLSKGYIGPDGSYVPPQAIPSQQPPQPAAQPPGPVSPLAAAVTSPEANAADLPQSQAPNPPGAPTSLEDFRTRLQQGEINLLKWIAPGTTTSGSPTPAMPMVDDYGRPIPGSTALSAQDVSDFARKAAATGVAVAATPVNAALNALVFAEQQKGGWPGGGGLTINPSTNQLQLTPEAMDAASLLTMGRPGGRDLQFSGDRPFVREPPSLLTQMGDARPLPVTMNELRAAMNRVPPEPYGPPAPPSARPTVEAAAQLAPGGQMPTAAGAQVSPTDVVGMTPDQVAIYRSTADGQKLLEPQPVGVPDRNAYVRGSNPNLAEQEQSVNTARELKSLGVTSPEVSQEAKQIAQDNNEARSQHFTEASGTLHDIDAEEKLQTKDIETAKPQVFAKSRAGDPTAVVDVAPIVEQIKQTMNEPINRQNDAIQKTLGDILNRLVDENGAPKITDPEELWGLRQRLDQMTGKFMTSQDSNLHYAAGTVSKVVKPLIDQAIEPAAPGFGDMLATYKAHAAKIEEMKLLQGYRNSLYAGSGGSMRMTLDKVQKMMRDIVDMQDPVLNDGVNPYQSIRPETMQKLWALRDDLRRSASAIELAKTPGSDTVQNVWDAIRGLATGPEAQAALHGFAATHFGVPGVLASTLGKRIIAPMIEGRAAAKQTQRGMEMLRPPNPLTNPNAPP